MVPRNLCERAGAVEYDVLQHRRQLPGDPASDDPAVEEWPGEAVAETLDDVRPRPDSAVGNCRIRRGHLHRRDRDPLADRHVADRRARPLVGREHDAPALAGEVDPGPAAEAEA